VASAWQSGVNFINVLQAAFKCADPKSKKCTQVISVFLRFLGSASPKAACKMFVKLAQART